MVLMVLAWTVSCFRLFQLLSTRSEKCFLKSVQHLSVLIFIVRPLVPMFVCVPGKKISRRWSEHGFFHFLSHSAMHNVGGMRAVNPVECKGCSAWNKLVHWPLTAGLLHFVQRRGAWSGQHPAQTPPPMLWII